MKSVRDETIRILSMKFEIGRSNEIATTIHNAATASTHGIEAYKEHTFQLIGQFMTVCDIDALTRSLSTLIPVDTFDTSAFDTFKEAAMADIRARTEGVKIEKCDLPCKNPRCRSDKCYFDLAQTRSADEGMTAFVICTKCHARYKLGN